MPRTTACSLLAAGDLVVAIGREAISKAPPAWPSTAAGSCCTWPTPEAPGVLLLDRGRRRRPDHRPRGSEPGEFNFPTNVSSTRRAPLCNRHAELRIQSFDPTAGHGMSRTLGDTRVRSTARSIGVDERATSTCDSSFNNFQTFDQEGSCCCTWVLSGRRRRVLPAGCLSSTPATGLRGRSGQCARAGSSTCAPAK